MEKFQFWFNMFMQNDTLMLFFWAVFSTPIGTWHLWYFRGKKNFSENELVKISRKFKGINSSYILFSIFGMIPLIIISLFFGLSTWNNWTAVRPGIKYFPVVFALSSGYGIYQGLFALIKGVYPRAKSLFYIYDEEVLIKRVAKYQILIAIAVDVIVILSGMAS